MREAREKHRTRERVKGGSPSAFALAFLNRLQAYLREIAGSVPDHHNKVSIRIKWIVIFVLGGQVACLQFIKK